MNRLNRTVLSVILGLLALYLPFKAAEEVALWRKEVTLPGVPCVIKSDSHMEFYLRVSQAGWCGFSLPYLAGSQFPGIDFEIESIPDGQKLAIGSFRAGVSKAVGRFEPIWGSPQQTVRVSFSVGSSDEKLYLECQASKSSKGVVERVVAETYHRFAPGVIDNTSLWVQKRAEAFFPRGARLVSLLVVILGPVFGCGLMVFLFSSDRIMKESDGN